VTTPVVGGATEVQEVKPNSSNTIKAVIATKLDKFLFILFIPLSYW